jgi:putative protein kinase ArgK-like GTPase of G3E family
VTEPAENAASLIEGIRAGDRRSLARAITFAESTRAEHRVIADAVLEAVLPATGNAVRIGISGPPGVGKSTFIEAFGKHIINQGHQLAVLAVDPSSRLTGGSILGDKTNSSCPRIDSTFKRRFFRSHSADEFCCDQSHRSRAGGASSDQTRNRIPYQLLPLRRVLGNRHPPGNLGQHPFD